jgi:imidazolonepropionase-like amidohydrolase
VSRGSAPGLACAFCLLASLAFCDSPTLPAGRYALVGLTLIDGTGAPPLVRAAVVVSEGRVEAAGPEAAVVPRDCPRVDLGGSWLLPGFINAHVHGGYDAGNLRSWLASGVTSVRDLGPHGTGDFLADRDRLNGMAGNALLISATPLISRPDGYGGFSVDGPESARTAVRSFVALGVDLVKIAVEDDLQGRLWPMLGAGEIAAIVAEAHAAGRKVSAHVSHVRNLPLAVEGGVDDLAHMVVEPLPAGTARAIAARGIAWVPTLELWKGVSEKHGLSWIRTAVANTGVFHAAGGRIALGTDFDGYSVPFDRGFPITEVRLLLEAGLSPMDVIVAGTRNAADAAGRLGDLGTVEKGKHADFLVVGRNPLENMETLTRPVLVVHGGKKVFPAH